MSGAIATAYVKLIPTFDKQLSSSIKNQLGGVDSSGAGKKVGRLFTRGVESGSADLGKRMAGRFSAATVAIGNVAANVVGKAFSSVASSMDSAIKRVDTMSNFPRIMEGMGIGADASAAAIKRLSDGIDGLPTALDDAVSGVSRFTAKNGDIEKSTDYFLAVNNAIASGGASMEIQSSALEQLSQSYSKGKMDMMEWRTLQMAMPAQINQIAQAMGTTADELGEGLRKGDISMDEFMDTIVRLNDEGVEGLDSFEKQARKATGGIGTAMTNVQNRVNKAVAGILDAIGQENISSAINAFSSQFGKIGKIIGGTDSDGNVVGFVAGMKRGLESAFDGWTPNFNIDWDSAFGDATKAAERVGELLSKPLSTFVKSWDEGMAHLSDTFQAAMNRLDLPEIDWDKVMDGVSGVLDAFMDFNFDLLANAVETVATIASWLQGSIGPAIEKLQPTFESLGRAAHDFIDPIADFVTGHGSAFDEMMGNLKTVIGDMGPYAESLAGHINNISEKLEPLAGPLGQLVAQSLSDAFTKAAVAADLVLRVLDKIAEHIDTITSAIEPMANAFDKVASLVSTAWGPVIGLLSQTDGLIGAITRSLYGLPASKTVNIYANDFASGVINNVLGGLSRIAGNWVARVTAIVASEAERASGGFTKLHANGGFITNGPTSLGYDRFGTLHIAGEAGREWVKKHADGTTSIVPIENRRYLKPYAEEIASMVGGTGTVNNYNITLDYNAGDDANKIVRDLNRAVRAQKLMGGRR